MVEWCRGARVVDWAGLETQHTNETINNPLPQALNTDMYANILARAMQIALEELTGVKAKPCADALVWNEDVRETFKKHLADRDPRYVRDLVGMLDRHLTKPIRTPKDVLDMFAACEHGKHHLVAAFRNFLKVHHIYYGLPKDVYEELKGAIPTTKPRADRYVPTEDKIIDTFRKVRQLPTEYQALFNIVLESPSRPMHVIEVLKTWAADRLRKSRFGEFYVYDVGMVKRTKACFRLHITPETLELIREAVKGRITANKSTLSNYYKRFGITPLKYVRKFAMNAMHTAGLTLDVIRLLAGEKPRTVLEEHYILVEKMAEQQYPKYLAYLTQLRRRI